MKIALKHTVTLALTAVLALGSLAPAQASMVVRPDAPVTVSSSGVTEVQYRRDHYADRRGYYRGHRGYRDRRPGYRYHNGYWYPLAAFAAGAIIGGAIASQPRPVAPSAGINPRHYQWCAARYRSYDRYSNTFQPYNAPRQQCLSPYY